MELTIQQRHQFDSLGFVYVGELFTGRELDEITAALESSESEPLQRYVEHPVLTSLVADLRGPGGCVHESVTAWLSLEDPDPEAEELVALPGSHRRAPLHLAHPAEAVPLRTRAGSVWFLSSDLVRERRQVRRSWWIRYGRDPRPA